jgi:hypothetical protein
VGIVASKHAEAQGIFQGLNALSLRRWLRNILVALDEGKRAAVSAAMLAHLEAAQEVLTAALEQRRVKRTAA